MRKKNSESNFKALDIRFADFFLKRVNKRHKGLNVYQRLYTQKKYKSTMAEKRCFITPSYISDEHAVYYYT